MKRRSFAIAAGVSACIALVGGLAVTTRSDEEPPADSSLPPGPIQLDSCNGTPPFATDKGLKNPQFVTATRDSQGLVVVHQNDKGEQASFIDPTYKSFGDLASIAITASGEVFVVGRPNIDVNANPPEQRNTIFRVDPNTGKLEPWADLPLTHEENDQPFGVMGLAVDCEEPFLYTTSLTGSSESEEKGTIWRIHRETKQTELVYEDIDAMAVAVGTSLGKRYLVVGSARKPTVLTAPLSQEAEPLQLLTELQGTGRWLSVRANKFRPSDVVPGQIEVVAVHFDFSLRAFPAGQENETLQIGWTPEGFQQLEN